jgi:predicted aldo/keto reductase-like oxidoreductase
MYHGGDSEVLTGEALKDGYREKVLLADKLPLWFAKEPEDMQRIFDEQLRRLDTPFIDFYLVHNVFEKSLSVFRAFDVAGFLKAKQAEGLIKHIGFSYHGKTTEFFKEVIDAFPWDFCQIQLNYMDAEIQAGVAGLKYAADKGIPVVIMEPLKGGKLTDFVPDSIQDLFAATGVQRSAAEWAFRWVADFPGILTILSGMSSMTQVEENLQIFDTIGEACLTERERKAITLAAAEYNNLIPYSCTACRYCMPCPVGLNIPGIISDRNEAAIYHAEEKIAASVRMFTRPLPSACTACRACEEKCPQHLPIPDIMKQSAELFE